MLVSCGKNCKHLIISRNARFAWIDKREMPATKIGRLWNFKISEAVLLPELGAVRDRYELTEMQYDA